MHKIAGCEYRGYTSDITRTWPINGTFSPAQRELYECLLDVQVKLIEHLKDRPPLDKLFEIMCLYLGKNLMQLGLIPNSSRPDVIAKVFTS